MNCETANDLMLDELYGELAAAARADLEAHASGCEECQKAWDDLKNAKKFAKFSEPDVPEGFLERVSAAAYAEFDAHAAHVAVEETAPVEETGQFGRVISLAGRWAMRPQARMAAVFLLMFGSSALFLRRGATNRDAARAISVSEEGTPGVAAAPKAERARSSEAEKVFGGAIDEAVHGPSTGAGGVAPASPAAAPAGTPAAPSGPRMSTEGALAAAQKGECEAALPVLDANTANSGDVALAAARCVKQLNGCGTAIGRFEQLAATARDPRVVGEATLEAGICQRQSGFLDSAMKRFQALAAIPAFAARAELEIASTRAALRHRSEAMAAARAAAPAAAPAKAAPKK